MLWSIGVSIGATPSTRAFGGSMANPILRAIQVASVHEAPAPRCTQMAGISDAARQALYSYRNHFFHMINQDEDRYYPG